MMEFLFDLITTIPTGGWVFIAISMGMIYYVRHSEQRIWNGGICAKSGQPWISFGFDSEGNRGYEDGEGNTCWISYDVDR